MIVPQYKKLLDLLRKEFPRRNSKIAVEYKNYVDGSQGVVYMIYIENLMNFKPFPSFKAISRYITKITK